MCDGEVDVAVDERFDGRVGLELRESERGPEMGPVAHLPPRVGHVGAGRSWEGCDSVGARLALAQRLDLHFGDADEVGYVVAVMGEDLAGGGEHDASALPFGEGEAHLALERRELHRDCGRGEVQLVGHGGDRAEPLQLAEHLKSTNI